jgi:rRNA maturation endonuclease Nob1
LKSAETFIEKSDIIKVENFAKDTGDFNTLSKVDKLVIALGIRLAIEKGDIDRIKDEP